MNNNNPISVIVPAAGMGRRMKSYGPKPLITIGNSTILNNQLSLINTYVPNANIVLICGFKSHRLMNETPAQILKVENELYDTTNVARSIGMGLRVVGQCSKVVVVYGDLVFNAAALKHISFQESSIIITDSSIGDEEVGCVIGPDQMLVNMMYDLPHKWGQIAFFQDQELELLKQMCWDEKNHNKFGFEIINQILELGGTFKCIQNDNIQIVDIDSSKDIVRAIDILL